MLAVAALAVTVAGCERPADNSQTGPPGGAMPAMPVTVLVAKARTLPVLIEAIGEAEGSKSVEVRARVTGLLGSQLYREGESIRSGAPMFTIERAPFEIALQQERALLAQEQAQVAQTRREHERLAPLARQQMVAQRDVDNAASALRLAETAAAAAQARVRAAELDLSYTRVTAPIGGIAGRAEKSQGSLVSAADGLLATITQADPIWIRFALGASDQEALRARPGAAVTLVASDGRPLVEGGRLNFTGSLVDPRLGTVPLRAEFPNPKLAVLPGQFVRVQVDAGEQQAFLVPQAAVVTTEQGAMVWTVQDGKATPTPVQTGGWLGHDWIIHQGLSDGDQVIVDNLMKLRPQAPVAPAAPQGAAAASVPASAASR